MTSSEPHVVVLDDEAVVASFLELHLADAGMKVLKAVTAREALSLAYKYEIGAAVIDIRLYGDDFDGIEVARRMRKLNPQVRIVFYTAFNSPDVHERARRFGLGDCAILSKAPNSTDHLRETLHEALDAYTPDRAAEQPDEEPQAPLVQLDVIDLALYRTLQLHPELLRTLEWRKFERLLADVLETLGYEVELQKGTKDGGIDIIALKKSEEWGDHRYLIQAKRWKNRVGVEPVQRLLFLQNDLRATKACLATTSTFTRGLFRVLSGRRSQIEFPTVEIDGVDEVLLIAETARRGLDPLNP